MLLFLVTVGFLIIIGSVAGLCVFGARSIVDTRKRLVARVTIIVAAVLLFLAIAPAVVYLGAPIRGKVTNVAGFPIEGAIVVVNWEVNGSHGWILGEMAVRETLTSASGDFEIHGWGPRVNQWLMLGHVRGGAPILRIFKPGYKPKIVSNAVPRQIPPGYASRYIRFRLDGSRFQLEEFDGPLEEYNRYLEQLTESLNFAYQGKHCDWKKVPLILAELHRYREQLNELGVRTSVDLVEYVGGQDRCGDARTYFREYLARS